MKMSKISSRKIAVWALAAVVLTVPVLTFAQNVPGGSSEGGLGNIVTLAQSIQRIIGILIPTAFALALLAFFYGVAKYIFSAGDEDSKATGQRIMIGGVIGIFVIAMIWGLVAFLGNTLGVNNSKTGTVPTVKGTTGITP